MKFIQAICVLLLCPALTINSRDQTSTVTSQPSKKIQAQLKELRYGKKDLIFKVSSNCVWRVGKLLCIML
ncbi:unnamed protein product [Tetraodon nigroviridis]|uniref:(spotted green pufferfish) hypothetical protein n=1 Tax=Tetraodon nigroviridis TaxID=99883 RepID=Q4SHF0_TETNG|nr:unnamed protein product [Tetraodon nigroviridis]